MRLYQCIAGVNHRRDEKKGKLTEQKRIKDKISVSSVLHIQIVCRRACVVTNEKLLTVNK